MSHETHAIESGWPKFEAFVNEWLGAPAEWERNVAAARSVRLAWRRRAGLVADRHARHCIGIELNPDYVQIAEKRLRKDGGMFADIVVAA